MASNKLQQLDATIIMPIKIDSADRLRNLALVLNSITTRLDIHIAIAECDTVQNKDLQNLLSNYNNIVYTFHNSKIFHRTKLLNDMTKAAKTPIVINHDVDCILTTKQYDQMYKHLIAKSADIVLPYEGPYYDVKENQFDKLTTNDVDSINIQHCSLMNIESVGGIVGYRKDRFLAGGGENENFISWGYEDNERLLRFQILKYTIRRLDGPGYHLTHYRNEDGGHDNPFITKNRAEYQKISTMKENELLAYIATWGWNTINKDETEALSLLTPARFDVTAKTIYARHKEKSVENVWAKYVYEHHLNVWGGFTEKSPRKNCIEDFYNSFNDVLVNIKQNGFDSSISKLPITKTGELLNGSHRLAASIIYNKPVKCRISDESEGQINCSANYFKHKKDIISTGLAPEIADAMALEYIMLKDSTYMVTIYEHCFGHMDKIQKILSKYNVKPVHTKKIKLPEKGQLNYVLSIYSDEPWIGNVQNNFSGIRDQVSMSFGAGPNIIALLVDVDNHSDLVKAKAEIRNLIGIGNPSIHTTDTKEETWKNATLCFNDNTIDYMNNAVLGAANSIPFMNFIKETERIINDSDITLEDICVVGSAPLGAYGKRDCKDFDVLHLGGNIPFNNMVSSHNQYARYYVDTPNDIIYNPSNHFYIEGLKFITPEGMIAMKLNRDEAKDKIDVALMREATKKG
jgi:hypothetical protein